MLGLWRGGCTCGVMRLRRRLEEVSTIDVPDEVAARLSAEAERRGVSVAALVAELAGGLPMADQRESGRLGFVGLGASGSDKGGREADELLADGFGRR